MTWTPPPALVEKVARTPSLQSVCSDGNSDVRAVARDVLTASPLGDAMVLLDRLINWCAADLTDTVAEARALLASLDARRPGLEGEK